MVSAGHQADSAPHREEFSNTSLAVRSTEDTQTMSKTTLIPAVAYTRMPGGKQEASPDQLVPEPATAPAACPSTVAGKPQVASVWRFLLAPSIRRIPFGRVRH